MITNDQLLKLFVLVPSTAVGFDGASVSGASGEHRIFFEQKTGKLWAKGRSYGIDDAQATALTTLIGDDTNKSVRTIAGEVVNTALNLTDNADATINTLKEVLNWFNSLPEGDAGALALVNAVGKPAEYYKLGDTIPEGKEIGDVKTAATGLYKIIEDSVSAKNVTADGASGELLVDATAVNNKVEVSSTDKLKSAVTAAENSIQTISVAGTALTVSGEANAKAVEITTAALQSALFSNTYESSPLTYSYLGVTVSVTEQNGELTGLNVDPSELVNRVSIVEDFDPWEAYSAPEPGE